MSDFTFAHASEGFDNHISNSIRGYSDLVDDVVSLSRYFVEDETNVYDLGASTGKMILRMNETNSFCKPNYIGVEFADGFKNSVDLINGCGDSRIRMVFDDIRNIQMSNASLVTSIFTLQFMPHKDRLSVLKTIYNSLNSGGAFVFSEKIYLENPRVQDMLTFMYYDHKRKTFSEKEILEKEVELRHMLKPNTWNEIKQMLESVGFKSVDVFWRSYNFIGAIALK